MTYSEKLKDPRWQKKRLRIMERDDYTCQLCMNDKEMLVIHHKKYISGKNPWDYPGYLLITLCNSCHNKFHGKHKETTIEDLKAFERSLERVADKKTAILWNEIESFIRRNLNLKDNV